MSQKVKIIILVTTATLIVLFFGFFSIREVPTKAEVVESPASVPTQKSEGVKVEAEEEITALDVSHLVYEGVNETSVYNFMTELRNEGKINFTDKYYVAMGKFIDSINGVKGNGHENWIYYVNGKKAEVGVSNNIISLGDVVSWKYEELLTY